MSTDKAIGGSQDGQHKKLCGNCCGDHKYVDCPVQDLQFPLTKIQLQELREKAKQYDNFKELAVFQINHLKEKIAKVKLFREKVELGRRTDEMYRTDAYYKNTIDIVLNELNFILESE